MTLLNLSRDSGFMDTLSEIIDSHSNLIRTEVQLWLFYQIFFYGPTCVKKKFLLSWLFRKNPLKLNLKYHSLFRLGVGAILCIPFVLFSQKFCFSQFLFFIFFFLHTMIVSSMSSITVRNLFCIFNSTRIEDLFLAIKYKVFIH